MPVFAIEIENLQKTFPPPLLSRRQPVHALRGIHLKAPQGKIYTLLGPNGSGKTTLIRILAGLIPQTAGEAKVNGIPVENQKALSGKIGLVIPGSKGFFGFMSGRENLLFFATLYRLERRKALDRIAFLAGKFGLEAQIDDPVKIYSSGTRQRLLLIRALLHDPDILLLDEPTVHLDPAASLDMRRLLRELLVGDFQKTVILTTHQLEEASELSETLGFIFKGRLVWEKPASRFRPGGENLLETYLATVHAPCHE